MDRFSDLRLRPTTLAALRAMGFETPTPIQAAAIPLLLQGEDLIAQAQTGTGKTAAFGIALVEGVDPQSRGIQALVLVPTRELALQVTAELNEIAAGSAFKAVSVFGGVGMGNQVGALKARSTTCVVACPGRLLDHLRSNPSLLDGVSILVLDEADRMLDMGFLPDVERIIRHTPTKRQTMLFSATMPDAIRDLSKRHLRTPESVRTGEDSLTTPLARQVVVEVEKDHKFPTLVALLGRESAPRAIVFTRTKHGARRVGTRLERAGFRAVSLQGDMSQNQRERAMAEFRDGSARILVATDVAARGLDVPDVTHVVHYDVPVEPEAYVHRTGRTGRMGKEGRAFLFLERAQKDELRAIETLLGERLEVDTIDVDPAALAEAETKAASGRAMAAAGGGGRGRGRGGGAPRGGGGGGRYGGHGHHGGHASHARRAGGPRDGRGGGGGRSFRR